MFFVRSRFGCALFILGMKNTMKRKFLGLLAVLAIVLSCFCACSDGSSLDTLTPTQHTTSTVETQSTTTTTQAPRTTTATQTRRTTTTTQTRRTTTTTQTVRTTTTTQTLFPIFVAPPVFTTTTTQRNTGYRNGGTIVYVTRTGECYHRISCGSLWNSCISTTLKEAVYDGYRACQRCSPPRLVTY